MPPTVSVDADAIPDELKERDQWLLWDASADTPRRPHWRGNFGASWTDPDDWHSFDEALAAVEATDSWGLGYVFAHGNDEYPRGLYCGIDLDGCVDERDRPKDWLPELEPFNGRTYMEYSPSGDGIHIPLVGINTPDWWSNVHLSDDEHEGVEFYEKKFFTFTGDPIETSAEDIATIPQAEVEEWLAAAYENITGDDPRELTPSSAESEPRETKKSREELADVKTTDDLDDVYDAVDHLQPNDLPLRSRKVEDENSEYESWDPVYRNSQSGKSLKRHKTTGIFFDMSQPTKGGGYAGFDVLSLFAAEEGIIREPWSRLEGEDFKESVSRARDRGAPIPEFVGGNGDIPEEAKEIDPVDLDAETMWELWQEARLSGEYDENNHINDLALLHVAEEHTSYDMESLPDDISTLPPKAHNRALGWVRTQWPEEVGLDVETGDDVTARRFKRRDEDVFNWEDVRYVYDGSGEKPDRQGGRYAAVKLLRSKYHFATPDDTEELHIYNEDLGVFERTAELEVNRELDRNLGRHYSQHEFNEIIGRLEAGTTCPRDDFEAGAKDGFYVCVENGVIDLDERTLLEHDPSYLFTNSLPVEYDPDAKATAVEAFLDDITRRGEDKLTMLEMLGNCLLPNYDYESFLVLFGEGSNGKSTFYTVVRRLLGKHNVTSMTLQTLSDNKFAASNLLGKLANIGEDLPEKKISDLGTIKDLTGGGAQSVEPKGKQRFEMENRAKLMFAANRPPILGERSKAIKRRLLPVRLPYQFVSNPNPDDPTEKQAQKEGLVDDLTTAEELSGLLNLALDGLERLRATGEFSLPESHDERLEYYEQFSDPIKEFAINCLENEEDYRIRKDVVYNAYSAFCRDNDYETSVRSTFWRELRRTQFNVSVVRPAASAGDSRPEYVNAAAFTELAEKYIPAEDKDDVPVLGRDATEDTDAEPATSDTTAGPTAIEDLTPGYTTLEVTVASVLEPKPWLQAEGSLTDETGVINYEARGNGAPDLEEGQTYRIDRAHITTDQNGVEMVEFRDGVTEVEQLGAVGQQSDLDSVDNDGATSTGGEASTDGGTMDIDVDEDAVGPVADAQRIAQYLCRRGCALKGPKLKSAVTLDEDLMDPKQFEAGLSKALEKGLVQEDDDGYVSTL